LIERLGEEVAEPVLLALTRMLVRATREERLPEFRGYAKALAEWDGSGAAAVHASDFIGLSIDDTLRRTLSSAGRPMRELYDALLGAALFNLLHFNTAFERATQNAIADNVGWLDFTHALTFANACRHICDERPDLWPRAALQLALFIGRNRKYAARSEDMAQWRIGDRPAFLADEKKALYDHGIPEPIIACHRPEGPRRIGGRIASLTRYSLGRDRLRRSEPLSPHADEAAPWSAHRRAGTRLRRPRRLAFRPNHMSHRRGA
jgi:hypothetical protein